MKTNGETHDVEAEEKRERRLKELERKGRITAEEAHRLASSLREIIRVERLLQAQQRQPRSR